MELTLSGDGALTREWVLVDVADRSQLGSPKRLAELEKMKQRKAEYGMTTVYLLLKLCTYLSLHACLVYVAIRVNITEISNGTSSIPTPSTQRCHMIYKRQNL